MPALDLQPLKDTVTRTLQVGDAVVAAFQGFAAEIEANKGNPAAISALATEMNAKADSWAAAITAGTPSDTPAAAALRGKR